MFFFFVIIELRIILSNAVASEESEVYSISERNHVVYNNSSQYSVPSASFWEIHNLWIKSIELSAFFASRTFAPMEVQLLSICLERTYSFFDSQRYW